jgi:hypothetical protein
MNPKCNGCGQRDVPIVQYRCIWPDKHITMERYCSQCRVVWTKQLKALGAKLEEIADDPGSESPRLV